jgi:putative copper export protein
VLLSVAHLAAWLKHVSPTHTLASDSIQAIVTSEVGQLELWRTALAVLASWAFLLARRRGLALLFAVGALLVSGAIGHSAAISPMLATPAKVLHLFAGAAWLGGLVWLLSIVPDDPSMLEESRRVSSTALIGVLLVLVSGMAQTLLFLPSLADLVRTTYGYLVLTKVAGLVVLVAFGAQHRFRSLPRLESDVSTSRLFHRSLAREVGVMVVVIIIGGVLAYVPPNH